MKKNILNEVYRTQQLMGVNKKIITEVSNPRAAIATEFFNAILKRGEKALAGELLARIGKQFDENLIRAIERGGLDSQLSEIEIDNMFNIIKQLTQSSSTYKNLANQYLRNSVKTSIPIISNEIFADLASFMAKDENLTKQYYTQLISQLEKEYPGCSEDLIKEFEKRTGKSLSSEVGEKIAQGLSKEQMIPKFGELTSGWKYFGRRTGNTSGWKFHVFGEDIYDSWDLYQRLLPFVEKWGALAKVGVLQNFEKGNIQYGKMGASIYIPVEVLNKNQQKAMLDDLQSTLSGYNKKGSISGDKSITDNITYRYELKGPVPKEGIDFTSYKAMYKGNEAGATYKPDDVEDIFGSSSQSLGKKVATQSGESVAKKINSGDVVSNNTFTDNMVNWGNVTYVKDMETYNKIIAQALKTQDYSKISRGGMENYGIPNFREWLMNNQSLERMTSVDDKTGEWFFTVK